MYADLGIAARSTIWNNIEATLTSALDSLTTYYTVNQLEANPTETQVILLHLHGDARKKLSPDVEWCPLHLPGIPRCHPGPDALVQAAYRPY